MGGWVGRELPGVICACNCTASSSANATTATVSSLGMPKRGEKQLDDLNWREENPRATVDHRLSMLFLADSIYAYRDVLTGINIPVG